MRADHDHSAGFRRLRLVTGQVADLRREGWLRIVHHLDQKRRGWRTGSVDRTPHLCILASSSRGGTSVTAEMLQWQGADCKNTGRRLLTMPGEEKPLLILSGLAFPTRPSRFDDLESADAKGSSLDSLLRELSSEVGYPLAYCGDLELYALQLYRRLLLQWPMQMLELDIGSAVDVMTDILRCAFPAGYCDTPSNRRLALACCCSCFPFARASFYDCSAFHSKGDLRLLDQGAWSFEEPPFVFPPPWHNPDEAQLARGTFLLRDPSNAWRLPFWKAVFPTQQVQVVHLVREVEEALQGLCDGWNYSFGFQTMPSDRPLRIAGYADRHAQGDTSWKRWRLNFSIDRCLSELLLTEGSPIGLVELCGYQWRHAHERILEDAATLSLRRLVIRFSELRQEPLASLREIGSFLCLELSRPGIEYARSFSSRWVMATTTAGRASHARWHQAQYAAEIIRTAASHEVAQMSYRLGLGADRDAIGADAQPWRLCEPA